MRPRSVAASVTDLFRALYTRSHQKCHATTPANPTVQTFQMTAGASLSVMFVVNVEIHVSPALVPNTTYLNHRKRSLKLVLK